MSKPNYPAEIAAKLSILNFKITFDGLVPHLLSVSVCGRERPDVEAEKNQIAIVKADTDR